MGTWSIVGGVAGAVIGSFIPGVGTYAGFAIGSAIGGVVDATTYKPATPLMKFGISQSAYGQMIPLCYGSKVRIAGNMIWSTDVVSTGTHKSDNNQQHFLQNMAYYVCEGVVRKLTRVWADGEVIYDTREGGEVWLNINAGQVFRYWATGTVVDQITGDITNGEIRQKYPNMVFTLYPGNDTQLPSPLIVNDRGAGNVSAYRGVAYVTIENVPLNKFGNRIPNFEFEIEMESVQSTAPSDPIAFSTLDMGTGYYTWGSGCTFVDAPNNKVYTITRTGDTTTNAFATPYHWFYNVHDLTGALISTTPMASVLTGSGMVGAWPLTKIGQYIYAVTWSTNTQANWSSGTGKLSKIDTETGLEVDFCAVNATVFTSGSSTQKRTAAPFVVNGVNYILVAEDLPSSNPNVSLINADTMAEVTWTQLTSWGGLTPGPLTLVADPASVGNSAYIYALWRDSGYDFFGLTKITYTIGSGLSSTHIDTIDPNETAALFPAAENVAGIAWNPTDSKLVALLNSGDDSYQCVVGINPANGDLEWEGALRTFDNFDELAADCFNLSDLSQGSVVLSDYYGFAEYSLTDGSEIGRWWHTHPDYDNQSCAQVWDGTNRYLGYVTARIDRVEYNGIASIPENAQPSNWSIPRGGYPVFGGWHDPNEPFYYLLRETYDYEGYELVKIDTATDEVVLREFFDYDDNTGAVTEVFAQESQVFGSPEGDKLYVWTKANVGGDHAGLIEFDKATLAVTNTYDFGLITSVHPAGGSTLTGDGGGGAGCMSKDGVYLVRASNNSTTGSFPNEVYNHAYLSVFHTPTGSLSVIDLFSHSYTEGLKRGMFFRADTYELWIVGMSQKFRTQDSAAKIYNYTVSGTVTPAISYVADYALTADDTTSYPYTPSSSASTLCLGASYHEADDKATIFLNKNTSGGRGFRPVLSFDLSDQSSSHVVSDFPTTYDTYMYQFDPETDGFAPSGYAYVRMLREGFPISTDYLEVLDAEANTVTELDMDTTFSEANVVASPGTAACGHYDADAEVYVYHVNGFTNDGADGYLDTLLSLATPSSETVVDRQQNYGDLCADVSRRSNLTAGTDYDYSTLDQPVRGVFFTQRTTGRDIIESQNVIYDSDVIESDWLLQGRKRIDSVSLVTIPESDVVAKSQSDTSEEDPSGDDDAFFQFKDVDMRQEPMWVDVSYFDPDRDYEVATEPARRSVASQGSAASNPLSLNLAAVLTGNEAATIGYRYLWKLATEITQGHFTLSQKYLAYEPADVVTLQRGTENFEHRLQQNNLGANFAVAFDSVSCDTGVSSITHIGSSYLDYSSGVVILASTPVMMVLDTAMLRDEDDTIGLYLTAGPDEFGRPWGGAFIEKSLDGTAYTEIVGIAQAPTWGLVGGTLNTANHCLWDRTNTLSVTLASGTLTPHTELELVTTARLNLALVGDELIQFSAAEQTGDNTWVLTNMLRGRFGTEWAVDGHVADEKFILFSTAYIADVTYPEAQIDASVHYRADADLSDSAFADDVTVVQETRRLKPYAPSNITGTRDGGDNLTGSYSLRSRFIGTVLWTPTRLETEVEVDIYDGVDVVRTITSTASAGGSVVDIDARTVYYSAADQTTDFGSPQAEVDVAIYALHDIVGRGYPGRRTI